MSLNFREVGLLLSELPLVDSVIQGVTEHDFHSLTFSLFHKEEKAWLLYVELGTDTSCFFRTGRMRKKSEKLQRLGQYLRAHVVGARIIAVTQVPGDRLFCLHLIHHERHLNLYFRFYSGPGANLIITDDGNNILELMMRRPQRGECASLPFILPKGKEVEEGAWPIREYSGPSFNAYIEAHYKEVEHTEGLEELKSQLRDRYLKEMRARTSTINGLKRKAEENEDYDKIKAQGDLLAANAYMAQKGINALKVTDFDGNETILALDPLKTPAENIEFYYQKYQKAKGACACALSQLAIEQRTAAEREAYYQKLFGISDSGEALRSISKELKDQKNEKKEEQENTLGLRIVSHGFDIIVGRNAKENDQILRTLTRGSDMWMHTRDYAGGYVVIKAQKDKSIPLEVLLDAGNLAVHFSKGKNSGKVDLYYTMCKYLRRAKGGKTGLVLPTQEKNITITLDEERIRRILS